MNSNRMKLNQLEIIGSCKWHFFSLYFSIYTWLKDDKFVYRTPFHSLRSHMKESGESGRLRVIIECDFQTHNMFGGGVRCAVTMVLTMDRNKVSHVCNLWTND